MFKIKHIEAELELEFKMMNWRRTRWKLELEKDEMNPATGEG